MYYPIVLFQTLIYAASWPPNSILQLSDLLPNNKNTTSKFLKLITPNQHNIYSINNPVGLKLLTHLRLGLSNFNEHTFTTTSTSHFLLHCHYHPNICLTLLNSTADIIGNSFSTTDECLVNLLLIGSQKYTEINNSHIVNATIKYLIDSSRFSGPLL